MTLLIHRIRAARAERRERAPEEVVNNLPWRIWTGTCWEKHDKSKPSSPFKDSSESITTDAPTVAVTTNDLDLEQGNPEEEVTRFAETLPDDYTATGDVDDVLDTDVNAPCKPSSSHVDGRRNGEVLESHPWFEAQTECAICLSDFERGDRIRVLPCKHIFHMEEIDEWLIHRKKLVSYSSFYLFLCYPLSDFVHCAALRAACADRSALVFGESLLSVILFLSFDYCCCPFLCLLTLYAYPQCPVCKADVTRPVHVHTAVPPHPLNTTIDVGETETLNGVQQPQSPLRSSNDNERASTERTPLLGVRTDETHADEQL